MDSLRRKIEAVLPIIRSLFGDIKTELDYQTPFQLLMAVILSAQTTDKQVNRVTPALFAQIRVPSDAAALGWEKLQNLVKSVNFYRNKAKYIFLTAQILTQRFHGEVPNDVHLLQTLPGIGVKTAKVVLSVLYDMPLVGVDTHVHRVCNRIGFVHTKTPIETDRKLEKLFTEEQKHVAHHPLVLFGRYVCTARKPKCDTCKVSGYCEYYGKILSDRAL